MRLLLLAWGVLPAVLGAAAGCAPESGPSQSEEVLMTEEVAGAIDAELSTDDDPRGRRQGESGRVLPPGFPAELPLPGGASVVERNRGGGGQSSVVLETPTPAPRLAASWALLLEAEGWSVVRSGELSLEATRAGETVSATVSAAGSGSRLRIVY